MAHRLKLSKPATEIIKARFSCRTYRGVPIPAEKRGQLESFLSALRTGPFGGTARFKLVAASEEDQQALRGLGTYGFIRRPAGFIIGAAVPGGKWLEDFGYLMELSVLFAADLGLGTCWLGGSFTRSGFAKRISAAGPERIPAIVSIGEIEDPEQARNAVLRRTIGGQRRLPAERLFFDRAFGAILAPDGAGPYAPALEAVRLGPSGSNRQPWRIVRDGSAWHFYLERTRGYGSNPLTRLLRVEDIQRVDLGIAMCHFELAALESGVSGRWAVRDPGIRRPSEHVEYTATWIGADEEAHVPEASPGAR